MGKDSKEKSKVEKELDKQAAIEIKRHIKAEMAMAGLTYKDLAKRMNKLGRPISEQSLRNKVSKGSHRTTWYWDLMKIIRSKPAPDLTTDDSESPVTDNQFPTEIEN
ncbi:DUF6471 domain-containing protein [Planctobacterium marinum]|uniref:DUF6471 domain-containing protein n=1 Tax=Planctobacterium marinum TaxID=1631968 RepID=A0AA48KSN6_9ALTE|nr:hypothetical protein MACH26_28580 [Planctobacterium marinum]